MDIDKQLNNYASSGDLFNLILLHSQGGNIHLKAFENAMFNVHLDVADYLIEHGVYILSDKNIKALKRAAGKGDIDVVKYFVKHGISKSLINQTLQVSAATGNLDILEYLVSIGGDIYANNNRAFELAQQNKKLDVLQYLYSR